MDCAAREAGIPLDEVLSYLSEELAKVDPVNMSLRLMGHKALKNGLTRLTRLAREGTREGKDFESTDLMAARELVRTALAAIKLSKEGQGRAALGGGAGEQLDLFDDPWDIKKVT